MRHIIYIVVIVLWVQTLVLGQQNDMLRFNFDNQYVRNPAALSVWNQSEGGIFYQRNFTAISNPPTTMLAGAQFAVPNQNVSAGLTIQNETAALIRNVNVSLSSSYKLLNVFKNGDFLAGGISAYFNQLSLDGVAIMANQMNDPLVLGGFENAIYTNIGFGMYYSSYRVIDSRRPRPSFQAGLSIMRAIPRNINLETISFQEQYYISSLISGYFPVSDDLEISTQLELLYEGVTLLNGVLSSRALFTELIHVGVSYDRFHTLGFMFGARLADLMSRETELDIYVSAALPLGRIDNFINNGIAIGMQYRFIGNRFTRF
jgi:type IX secretion system PorP/SprF family membrane protein